MQIIVDGREIKGNLDEHLAGRIVTSRRESPFLLEITTSDKSPAISSILASLSGLLDGADTLMVQASMAVACGDDDAPEKLQEALDFWRLFAETCDLLLSVGYNIDAGRFSAADTQLRCIEDAVTPLEISQALGVLADEAEWWRERIHDAADNPGNLSVASKDNNTT